MKDVSTLRFAGPQRSARPLFSWWFFFLVIPLPGSPISNGILHPGGRPGVLVCADVGRGGAVGAFTMLLRSAD
jgi:hypothetical protein